MRHNILIASLFALSAIIVSSCAKEQLADNNDKKPEYKSGQIVSIFATTQQVKTSNDGLDTKWVADDAMNVFHADAEKTDYNYGSNDQFTIDSEHLLDNRFVGELTEKLYDNNDWYLLYPYNKYIETPANTSKGYLPIGSSDKSVAQVQTGNSSTAHLCGQYFPLYGKATGVAKGDSPVIAMNQALCVVKVHVTNNSTEPLTVTTVSLEANEDITGTYYIDFTGDTPVFTSSGNSYVSNTVNLTVNDGAEITVGGEADFYLAVKPFTAAKGTSLEITVNGVSKTVSIPATKDVEFKPGTIKKISYSYAPPAPVAYTLVTSLDDIEEGDYIITNGDYALQNTFTSSATAVLSSSFGTIAEGVFTTSSTQCVWTFTGDNKSMTIRPYGSDTDYLYATSATEGLKVGTTSDSWAFEDNNGATNGFSMKEASNSRYCAIFVDNSSNPKDWRTYTSAQHSNYKLNKGALLLYKVASTTPKIIPGDDIVAPATGIADGSLTYTVKNFEDDVVPSFTGCVTAAAINTKGTVTYTVSPNYTLADVDGTITLTSASTGATATVNVSQAASVFEVVADNPVVIGNKAEDEGSFTIKSTFGGTLTISDTDNFIINETYEANEEGTTVIILAINDGAAADREAIVTVTRQGQESVVVNIKQNKLGAQPLAVPTDVNVTTHTTSKIAASWTGDANASSYDWIISTCATAAEAESSYTKKGNTTDTSMEIEDTFFIGTYYFYVRSVGDGSNYATSAYASSTFEIKEQHSLTVDFEKVASAYRLWEFTNAESHQTETIAAHGGTYYGTTGGKASASIQTKDKIANPVSINFFISKQSTNTAQSSWKVEVSSNKTEWTIVGDEIAAASMTKGTWVEVNRNLSSYSNVYVRISYGSSTACRNIDDLVLTYEGEEIEEPVTPKHNVSLGLHDNGTITASVGGNEITSWPASLEEGTEISITATPTDGYKFSSWSITGASAASSSATTAITVESSDITIGATFTEAGGGTGTLKITRDSFPSGTLAYNVTDSWSVVASTGETVSGEGDLYSTATQTTMQSKNSGVSTMYHNTVAVPGNITKITLKCASGTTRTYTAYMNKTTAITSTSGGTSKGTIAPEAGNTASLSLDAKDGWQYFWLNLAGGASYLDYIEIEYTTN